MKRGPKKGSYRLTKEYLIDKIKEATNLLGHTPSKREMAGLTGFPGHFVYQKRFGSWRLALESAGISCEHFGQKGGFIRGTKYCWAARIFRKQNPNNRMPLLRIRFDILQRDNFTCQYCGRTVQDGAKLAVDHIVPFSKGGKTTFDNLITSCFECNVGKNDILLMNHLENKKPDAESC